jgi:hypothetical protein
MIVQFVPIDKEQPELPLKMAVMDVLPFPGEEVDITTPTGDRMVVRVIRREFRIDTTFKTRPESWGPEDPARTQVVVLYRRVVFPAQDYGEDRR